MSDSESMDQFLAIGVNPAERDGTVSFAMVFGADRQYAAIPWRDAVAMLAALHRTIHEAAHDAGVDEEELVRFMEETFDRMDAAEGMQG